jgi:hypothetical protein
MGKDKSRGEDYPKKGYVLLARKITHGPLVRDPYAFTLFQVLIAWANFSENENRQLTLNGKPIRLKVGQVPISPRNLAERFGWGVNRVYKALRLLIAQDCIRKEVGWEGTIVTVLKYHVYQDNRSYTGPSYEAPTLIPSGSPPLIPSGSPPTPADPSGITLYRSSLLRRSYNPSSPSTGVIASYLDSLPKTARKQEEEKLAALRETHSDEEIALCVEWLRQPGRKVRSGRSGELRRCVRPLMYLCTNIDEILDEARKTGSVTNGASAGASPTNDEGPVKSIEEMEREVASLEAAKSPQAVFMRMMLDRMKRERAGQTQEL